MARKPGPHPETDPTGETIEFEPVPPPEFIWVEVNRADEVLLWGGWPPPVEIRLGQTTDSSPLFLDQGRAYEEVCEAAGVDPNFALVVVQPDVMAEDPRRGWAIIPQGEKVRIGRAVTPQFRLGNDVSRNHLEIENNKWEDPDHVVRIANEDRNPIKVRVDRDYSATDLKILY